MLQAARVFLAISINCYIDFAAENLQSVPNAKVYVQLAAAICRGRQNTQGNLHALYLAAGAPRSQYNFFYSPTSQYNFLYSLA